MKIKVIIENGSIAAESLKGFMAEKEAFRKAAEAGKAAEYTEKNPEKFANALPDLTPQQ